MFYHRAKHSFILYQLFLKLMHGTFQSAFIFCTFFHIWIKFLLLFSLSLLGTFEHIYPSGLSVYIKHDEYGLEGHWRSYWSATLPFITHYNVCYTSCYLNHILQLCVLQPLFPWYCCLTRYWCMGNIQRILQISGMGGPQSLFYLPIKNINFSNMEMSERENI